MSNQSTPSGLHNGTIDQHLQGLDERNHRHEVLIEKLVLIQDRNKLRFTNMEENLASIQDSNAKILSILSSGITSSGFNSGNSTSGITNSGKNTFGITNSGKDTSGIISASTPAKVVGEEEKIHIPFTPMKLTGEEEKIEYQHLHEDLPWDYVTSEVSISGNNYSQNAYDCDVHIAIGDNNHHDDDKIYSNIDNVFKGLNPGCNITHILSYFDRKTALSSVFTQPARPTVVKEISRHIPGAWNQVQFLVFLRKFFDPGIIHVPLLLLILLLNSSKGLTWVLLM
jgi:hypothetical protein